MHIDFSLGADMHTSYTPETHYPQRAHGGPRGRVAPRTYYVVHVHRADGTLLVHDTHRLAVGCVAGQVTSLADIPRVAARYVAQVKARALAAIVEEQAEQADCEHAKRRALRWNDEETPEDVIAADRRIARSVAWVEELQAILREIP